MFQPSKILNKKGTVGIVEFTYNVIMTCDEKKREALWKHVILSGGNTMYQGFEERFNNEMQKFRPRFRLVSVEHRIQDVSLGGAIYASLSNYRNQCEPKPARGLTKGQSDLKNSTGGQHQKKKKKIWKFW